MSDLFTHIEETKDICWDPRICEVNMIKDISIYEVNVYIYKVDQLDVETLLWT